MRIFIDLDDTLIYSTRHPGNPNLTWLRVGGKDGEKIGSVLRPIAINLIEFIKTIDPNPSIITVSGCEWANSWIRILGLYDYFCESNVYTNENFIQNVSRPYGGYYPEPNGKTLAIEDAIIIDNEYVDAIYAKNKMLFVNGYIKPENWIQIKPFEGDVYKDEIEELGRIKGLIKSKINK